MEREVVAPPASPVGRVIASALAAGIVGVVALAPSVARADTLPDGRAYELVTPGLNGLNISLGHAFYTQATASGDGLGFVATDALDSAPSSGIYNTLVATRGPGGWTVTAKAIPFGEPESGYLGTDVTTISSDLSQALVLTDQPLTPGSEPGDNLYLEEADGAYTPITDAAQDAPGSSLDVSGVSADFSHVFFNPDVAQLPSDPVNYNKGDFNLYQWAGGQLSIVNVMPNGALSTHPAVLATPSHAIPDLPSISADGDAVLFQNGTSPGNSPLYLRMNGTSTVEAGAAKGGEDPTAVGITADASQALFTSSAELTKNANTGQGDAGNDLYDYDVATGTLTDLTPDANSADAGTGADVQEVIGADDEASYIYFIATGDLASGATSGQDNLYVEHDGTTSFIAPATGILGAGGGSAVAYNTPDGENLAFESTDSLTGYDNTDQATGQPDTEVYEYDAPGGTLVCASCRPDGSAPTGGSTIPGAGTNGENLDTGTRVISDDGSRVFFDSTDQVVPGASNGLQNVYEYEGGSAALISPGTGASAATLVDASASGDDVFFDSYDDVIPPLNASLQSAIWDARVGGGFPITATTEGVCTSTPQCRATGSTAPGTPAIATDGPSGNLKTASRLIADVTLRSVRPSTVVLRARVRTAGWLTASGTRVRTLRRRVRRAGTVTLSLRLTRSATARLARRHSERLVIHLRFVPAGGRATRLTVHVTAKKRGHR